MSGKRIRRIAISLLSGSVLLLATIMVQDYFESKHCPTDAYENGVCITTQPEGIQGGFPIKINGVDFYPAAIVAADILFFSVLVYLGLIAFDKRRAQPKKSTTP